MDDLRRLANPGDLVLYISPFGLPKRLPRWQAEAFLESDERRWLRLQELEMVTDAQNAVGQPHIEND
jgi:hypothetical protein